MNKIDELLESLEDSPKSELKKSPNIGDHKELKKLLKELGMSPKEITVIIEAVA